MKNTAPISILNRFFNIKILIAPDYSDSLISSCKYSKRTWHQKNKSINTALLEYIRQIFNQTFSVTFHKHMTTVNHEILVHSQEYRIMFNFGITLHSWEWSSSPKYVLSCFPLPIQENPDEYQNSTWTEKNTSRYKYKIRNFIAK